MENVVKKINEHLNSLEKGSVVGLDGYSGIGKTTISKEIIKMNSRVHVLHLDDYVVTANTKEKLEPQISDETSTLDLEWADVERKGFSALIEDIEQFRKNGTQDMLLVEGIFFFHADVLPNIFDKKIFLEGDEKMADERRIKREKARWGDKYFPETHPDSFARLFKLAWGKYKKIYQPSQHADLVVEV